MPWRTAVLRGTRVLARCDERGELRAHGGRVEIRYRPGDAKSYQAGVKNLELLGDPEIFPEDHCNAPDSGGGASAKGDRTKGAPAADARFIAYTDGACSGNPGPAGLGVVLQNGESVRELSEYLGTATNNIAELTAILRVLEAIEPSDEPVLVHTDSQYAIGVLSKGWKPKANQELIREIKERMRAFKQLRFFYVRGHAGVPLNERADGLARAAVSSRSTSGWQEVEIHARSHG